jgi:hypothetical protein
MGLGWTLVWEGQSQNLLYSGCQGCQVTGTWVRHWQRCVHASQVISSHWVLHEGQLQRASGRGEGRGQDSELGTAQGKMRKKSSSVGRGWGHRSLNKCGGRRAGGRAQVVESLRSKRGALSSNPCAGLRVWLK